MHEESLFAAVLEKPTSAERLAHLETACAGDPVVFQRMKRLLLSHEQSSGILDHSRYNLGFTSLSEHVTNQNGTVIGNYVLKELLGEGGFGQVYAGEQHKPVRRDVAIKVIKPGMNTREVLARFDSERQALALMEHSNIARVYDAGTTESGCPYFVMELVRGVPITDYADNRQMNTQARLRLFSSVCFAVHHAHQKGIIHRDLKPSNVLVITQDDQAVVKVIDFGVSKALDHSIINDPFHTHIHQMIGTPTYMSPEQAGMNGLDIDTRTDIYSLGVMLYELLVGTTPFDRDRLQSANYDEMRRIIREEEPLCPSTRISALGMMATTVSSNRQANPRHLSQIFRGELDWIVMKAMEKDRERRYSSASEMARDLQRYLRQEPIEASPRSTLYRVKKFLQRNHTTVLALAVMFLLLCGGAIGTTLGMFSAWEARNAEAERAEGERRERHRAEQAEDIAKNKAAEAVKSADAALALVQFLRKDLLGRAGVQSQTLGFAQPNPNLTVREALDQAALNLGDHFKNQPDVEAAIRYTIGEAYSQLGQYQKAIEQIRRSLDYYSTLNEDDVHRQQVINAKNTLAMAYCHSGRPQEAIPILEEIRTSQANVSGEDNAFTLTVMSNLAVTYYHAGRKNDASNLFAKVHDARSRTLGPDDPATLCTLHNIATLRLDSGKLTEAIEIFEQVFQSKLKVLGEEHADILPTLGNLGVAYWKSKQLNKSIPVFEKVVQLSLKLLGANHPESYRQTVNLGVNYRDAGRLDEAIACMHKAYVACQRQNWSGWIADELHIAYVRAGKTQEAVALIKDRLSTLRNTVNTESLQYASILAQHGFTLLQLQSWADAETVLRQCLSIRQSKAPQVWTTSLTKSLLGRALLGQGKYAEAEETMIAAYKGLEQHLPAINPQHQGRLEEAIDRIIQLYTITNKPEEVTKWQAVKAKHISKR